jgi:phosphoribosylformimino-5-aminoimidazole carboxamide ribotide isomerase
MHPPFAHDIFFFPSHSKHKFRQLSDSLSPHG